MSDNNNCTNKKKWLDTCGTLFNLLLAICGTATAIFAYHASLNANEISRRSFENAELSAQPIISGYIDTDSSLTINIQKEYRGINFVNATPVITLMEGVINDNSARQKTNHPKPIQSNQLITPPTPQNSPA